MLAAVTILFSNCNDSTSVTNEPTEIRKLSSIDRACGSSKSLENTIADNDVFFYYSYENDTLKIEMEFHNTCGSAYSENTKIEENEMQIFLNDTSSSHDRCICLHGIELAYYVVNTDEVNLDFQIKHGTNEYSSLLDTLISLKD